MYYANIRSVHVVLASTFVRAGKEWPSRAHILREIELTLIAFFGRA